jgi:hypothetical protein
MVLMFDTKEYAVCFFSIVFLSGSDSAQLLSFVSVCIVAGDLVTNREGWGPINQFDTATFVCLFQAMT